MAGYSNALCATFDSHQVDRELWGDSSPFPLPAAADMSQGTKTVYVPATIYFTRCPRQHTSNNVARAKTVQDIKTEAGYSSCQWKIFSFLTLTLFL